MRQLVCKLYISSAPIEALSSPDTKVPGTGINTGEISDLCHLNEQLRRAENDCRALVLSGILRHVPRNLKRARGIDSDFAEFTGEQADSIVEAEHDFAVNLVYPWFGNRPYHICSFLTARRCRWGAETIHPRHRR